MNTTNLKRFYTDDTSLKVGSFCALPANEASHLSVVRINQDEEVILLNNTNYLFKARIIKIDKYKAHTIMLQITEQFFCTANPKCRLTVYMALAKGEKLDLITQKLTELGATKLVPFVSQNCVKDKLKTERLKQIAISAAKQCGRSTIIEITEVKTLKEILPSLKDCLFANETETVSLSETKNLVDASILIGPEGGFTANEIQQIINVGAKSISLGKRILRAETAAIALATIVKHHQGEI